MFLASLLPLVSYEHLGILGPFGMPGEASFTPVAGMICAHRSIQNSGDSRPEALSRFQAGSLHKAQVLQRQPLPPPTCVRIFWPIADDLILLCHQTLKF